MIDIKLIRENPALVKENIKKKFQNDRLPLVDEVIKLDSEWRKLRYKEDTLRSERNKISELINQAKKSHEEKRAKELIKKAKSIPEEIAQIQENRKVLEKKIRDIMYQIPNIIHNSVPIGKDGSQNVVRKVIGKPKKIKNVKSHVELGEMLGVLDFDTSAEVSGKGFYYIKGDLALLNAALINFARDYMVKQGFEYVETPLLIKKEILEGVYSNEEINVMSYKLEGEDLYMIATSEHPLIGQFINKTLNAKDLPLKQTSYSMCFRREIGSHGIDEKGIFRTHQFNKQEMIVICEPSESYKWYDKMLKYSIDLFKELGIPIRVLESCSGDLANLKAKGCDIEAWSPRQEKYFEVTSLTNMEEAQARRLNIKIDNGKERYFAHTLNNTAIATSRALVAIMENFQQKDGSILIPKVLQKYMHGKKKISAKNKTG
ncbi:serine--tRNA ligase [Candidatus Pacearchaeota archaeon RBG_16_35_8]|nr:MAG: serine--tRNA ligase [Candidatus Pacearchaeota archaeon RBG_16_35_8]